MAENLRHRKHGNWRHTAGYSGEPAPERFVGVLRSKLWFTSLFFWPGSLHNSRRNRTNNAASRPAKTRAKKLQRPDCHGRTDIAHPSATEPGGRSLDPELHSPSRSGLDNRPLGRPCRRPPRHRWRKPTIPEVIARMMSNPPQADEVGTGWCITRRGIFRHEKSAPYDPAGRRVANGMAA